MTEGEMIVGLLHNVFIVNWDFWAKAFGLFFGLAVIVHLIGPPGSQDT